MTTQERRKIPQIVRPIWDAWMRFGTNHGYLPNEPTDRTGTEDIGSRNFCESVLKDN